RRSAAPELPAPAAVLLPGTSRRHETEPDQDEVGEPHRERRAHSSVLGPRLSVGNQDVVHDQDRERDREAAALSTAAKRVGERDADEREGEARERNRELLVDLDERQTASFRGHLAQPNDLEELRQRLGA